MALCIGININNAALLYTRRTTPHRSPLIGYRRVIAHRMPDLNAVAMLRDGAHAIAPEDDYAFLLNEIGDASLILLGESAHGSHEFYRARAKISRLLIREKGFDAIAVEADWPDALGANRYVQNTTPAEHLQPKHALDKFQRFPLWMWRNTEIVKLMKWLQLHNAGLDEPDKKSDFSGWTCTACTVPYKRWCNTWTGSTRRLPYRHAHATAASTMLRMIRSNTAMPPPSV